YARCEYRYARLPLLAFMSCGAQNAKGQPVRCPTRRSPDLGTVRRLNDAAPAMKVILFTARAEGDALIDAVRLGVDEGVALGARGDRKSTRLNSSHLGISYAVFCLKKKTYKLRAAIRPTAHS